MTPGSIWRKTLIFSWINLGIGLLTFFICMIIGAVAYLMIQNGSFAFSENIIIGCSAFLLAAVIYFLIMSRFGYSNKIGQLAIVERAHGGDSIPANPVEFSKGIVQARFGSSRKYYSLARNLNVARRQMTRVISRGFSLDSDSPVLSSSRWFLLLAAFPALTFVDECCLAYALRRKDYEVYAAAIDGLTILVQDWKKFLSGAIRISLLVFLVFIVLYFLFFIPGFMICKSMVWSPWSWAAISFFLVMTIKIAFVDSYVLTKIVCNFLSIAGEAKIESKNYAKLDSWSKMYAKLRKIAEDEAEKAENAADKAERLARKKNAEANHHDAHTPDSHEDSAASSSPAHDSAEDENHAGGRPLSSDAPSEAAAESDNPKA